MLRIIFFVLIKECVLTSGNANAVDSNNNHSNNFISYTQKLNGDPLENYYKPYEDIKPKATQHKDKGLDPAIVYLRRLFDFINIKFPKGFTKTASKLIAKDKFNRISSTTPVIFTYEDNGFNWLSKHAKTDKRNVDQSNKDAVLPSEPLAPISVENNKVEAIKDKEMKGILNKLITVLMELNTKLQEITTKKNGNEEEVHISDLDNNILTENGDVGLMQRKRYRRQAEKIPVEVKALSVENNATYDKLNSTNIKAKINGVITKNSSTIRPKLLHSQVIKENDSLKSISVKSKNADIQNLTLEKIMTELKKGNFKYVDKSTSFNGDLGGGKVNDSQIFKIRVKRKVNVTGLNVFDSAFSEKYANLTNVTTEPITDKNKTSNVTKVEVGSKTVYKDDDTQVTSKSCNESQQVSNGRRAYGADEKESEVKQKILKYMEETFTEIFLKIQPLQEIKRSFGTLDMYRVGYIAANLDTLETNLRNLKTELESNKDGWSDKKIMDIFDKLMTTNKIVSNLLTSLQTFSPQELSSARPYVPYGQKFYQKAQDRQDLY